LKVVVDASNVAHFGRRRDAKPSLEYIIKAAEALQKLGYEPILIADASLRHEIDQKEEFNQLLDEDKIQQVPSGTT